MEMTIMKAINNIEGRCEWSHGVKVPEPKSFNDTRNANELENFIWDIEQYFVATHSFNGEKMVVMRMYLTRYAKLWWRTHSHEDELAGRHNMET